MSLRAVVFDMDGLLIDSERAILECWRAAARELGLAVPDLLWTSMVGLHEAACEVLLQQALGQDQARRLSLQCTLRYDRLVDAGLPLMPGARALLQDLRGADVPIAIATSTVRERAEVKLARSGIAGFFDVVITRSDVAEAKPAPDVYLLAARRLGVPPSACVALEDSEFGVRAAAAAGMRVIQVPDLVPSSELSRSLAQVVGSLEQARPLLQSLLGIALTTRAGTPTCDLA